MSETQAPWAAAQTALLDETFRNWQRLARLP